MHDLRGLLLSETHLRRKGAVRLPFGGCPRRGLLHHLVHLLKGKTLGLGNKEVGVDKSAAAQGAPDEEHLGAKVALVLVRHVGRDLGDDLVSISNDALGNMG